MPVEIVRHFQQNLVPYLELYSNRGGSCESSLSALCRTSFVAHCAEELLRTLHFFLVGEPFVDLAGLK